MKTITKSVILLEEIIKYFEDELGGECDEGAYYELLEETEDYLKKPNDDFLEYLEFLFNINDNDFTKIKKSYNKKIKLIEKYL